MASDPTRDKVNHATKGLNNTANNSHSKRPHGMVPNDDDPTEPFLSQIVEDGMYHSTNTPNGCVYGSMGGKDKNPGFGIQGPQMNTFRLTFPGSDDDDWDGNRSGE